MRKILVTLATAAALGIGGLALEPVAAPGATAAHAWVHGGAFRFGHGFGFRRGFGFGGFPFAFGGGFPFAFDGGYPYAYGYPAYGYGGGCGASYAVSPCGGGFGY